MSNLYYLLGVFWTLHTCLANVYMNKAIGWLQRGAAESIIRRDHPSSIVSFYEPNRNALFDIKLQIDDIKYKIYSPELFAKFRSLAGVTENEFLANLNIDTMTCFSNQSDSRSGAGFWLSADQKYIIKTIKPYECDKLLELLPSLEQHVSTGLSCLGGIFGLYRLQIGEGKKLYVLVIRNIYPIDRGFTEKYDLKGSTIGRVSRREDIMKDADLINTGRRFHLKQHRQGILDILHRDTMFLRNHGLMDYSLLVATEDKLNYLNQHRLESDSIVADGRLSCLGEDCVYHFGIIDFLQPYSYRKMVEHSLKSIYRNGRKISCVNPAYYQERFMEFIQSITV